MKAYKNVPIPSNRDVQKRITEAMQFTAESLMDSLLAEPYDRNELTIEEACLSKLLMALFDLYMNRHRPREMGEKGMSAATGISIEKLEQFAFHTEMFGPDKGIQ